VLRTDSNKRALIFIWIELDLQISILQIKP
jgi:hypothetical protein